MEGFNLAGGRVGLRFKSDGQWLQRVRYILRYFEFEVQNVAFVANFWSVVSRVPSGILMLKPIAGLARQTRNWSRASSSAASLHGSNLHNENVGVLSEFSKLLRGYAKK
jgi:hypothetical protein